MDSNSSIKDILVELGFGNITDAGKNFRCRPAYRQSSSASVCSIQKETGLWYDFKENIGGNLQDLVSLCLNIDRDAAQKFLSDKNYVAKSVEDDDEIITTVKKYPREWLANLEQSNSYWAGRGVSSETLERFNGGVATGGRMYHRYVFPMFDEAGAIIGFVGRDLLKLEDDTRPKWKILGAKDCFCYPYYFNKQEILREKSVILVESIGDMLSLWDNGIRNTLVTFGLSLSSGVVKTLIKTRPEQVIVSLNNDSAGNCAGNDAAIEFRNELRTYFDYDTVRIEFPTKKDFGEMTKDEIKLWQNQSLRKSQHQE